MTLFVFFAAMMCAVAVAIIILPLRAGEAKDGEHGSNNLAIIGSIVFVPALALGVYLNLSNWVWDSDSQETSIPSLDQAIQKLEQRVTATGGSIQDWYMLGRSYVVMQEYAKAVPAFRQAYTMSEGQDPEIAISLAESMALADENALDGEAGELIEQSVATSPNNAKALWYGGLVAERKGDKETAVSRYKKLMTLAPPEAMQKLLLQRIQTLGGQMAVDVDAAQAGTPSMSETGIAVQVTIADAVRNSVNDNLTLFILARDVSGTGPPIAVLRRRVADLPLSVRLTDEQAMMPSRKISNFDEVQIVARVSRSGQPIAQTGDVFGQTNASNGDSIALIIDQVVP